MGVKYVTRGSSAAAELVRRLPSPEFGVEGLGWKNPREKVQNVAAGCSAQRLIFQLASEMAVYLAPALLTGSRLAAGRLPWDA